MAHADDTLLAEADDHFHDECGVFGIFGRQDAAAIVTLGLHALQHRGQEAAGIVSYDGTQFHVERHIGLIGDTFTKPRVIESLKGSRAIGHTRYATTGGSGLRNVQPLFRRACRRRLRHRPQRQHHQRHDRPAHAAEAGRDLLLDLRHRDHPASRRHQPREGRQLALHRGRAARSRARSRWSR